MCVPTYPVLTGSGDDENTRSVTGRGCPTWDGRCSAGRRAPLERSAGTDAVTEIERPDGAPLMSSTANSPKSSSVGSVVEHGLAGCVLRAKRRQGGPLYRLGRNSTPIY